MVSLLIQFCLLAISFSALESAAGGKLNIEVKLVADKSMSDFYGDQLQSYLLKLFYSTQSYFTEEKLGFPIIIALTNIETMSTDPKDLDVKSFDKTYLLKQAFDEYITKNKQTDEHFDMAVLLTRQKMNLVKSNGYFCDSTSNGVLTDEGFTSAIELAGLIALTFGMQSDVLSRELKCKGSAFRGSILGQHWAESRDELPKYFWSECSIDFVKKWIDRVDKMPCIRDEPKIDISPIFEERPGQVINPTEQCSTTYGKDYEFVLSARLNRPEVCQALRCIRREQSWPHKEVESQDRRMAALEGSICGNNKICISGICTEEGKYEPQVNSATNSRWRIGKWSVCCGEATKTRTIKCVKGSEELADKECEKYLTKPTSAENCRPSDVAFCTKDSGETTIDKSGCPNGWTREGSLCYRSWYRNGTVDGYMTDLFCKAHGGLTAHIMNQKQNDLVLRMLGTGTKYPDGKRFAHIGVRWVVPSPSGGIWGGLQWLDGTQVYSDTNRSFLNWGRWPDDEKLGEYGWNTDKCTVLTGLTTGDNAGKWTAVPCEFQSDLIICSKAVNI